MPDNNKNVWPAVAEGAARAIARAFPNAWTRKERLQDEHVNIMTSIILNMIRVATLEKLPVNTKVKFTHPGNGRPVRGRVKGYTNGLMQVVESNGVDEALPPFEPGMLPERIYTFKETTYTLPNSLPYEVLELAPVAKRKTSKKRA